MYIRNHYIYSKKYKIDWSTAKGVGHPDDMSNAIMKRVLEMLR
jgi:S-adenosylmethionine synthetase